MADRTWLLLLLTAAPAWGQDADPLAAFRGDGPSERVVARDGGGFLVTFPDQPAGPRIGGPVWDRNAPFGLAGDFEFSCGFDISKLGSPGANPAGEAKVGLALVGPETLEFAVGCSPNKPSDFRVMRITRNSRGTHYNGREFPRTGTSGKLILRRRGGEVIFLAADGPAAQPVELLRYPIDPQTNPRPRITSFRQPVKELVPVAVRLTDVTLAGGRQVTGAAAGNGPPDAPPAAYPVRVAYAGNPAGLLGDFSKSYNRPGWFAAEGSGVRAKPPVVTPHRKDAQAFWVRDSRYTVAGDFEVTLGYDIRQLGPPGPEGYSGPSFGLSVEADGPLGSLNLKREVNRENKRQFVVARYTPTKTGSSYDFQSFASDGAPTGRLVMRRTSGTYTLLAADGADAEPRELTRFPFLAGPVGKLRLMFDQGGTATAPLDVALTELTVRADKLTDDRGGTLAAAPAATPAGSPAEVALDAVPRPQSRKWLYLGLAAAVLAGVGLAAGLMGLARRSARPPA